MTIFDRFNIRVIAAGAGLCGAAVALSPHVAAAPLVTGGYECMQDSAGVAAGGAPAAAVCSPASAPVADMAGVPLALPGPVPAAAPVPLGAPLPVGAPVPLGAPVPVGAPVPADAPVAAAAPAGALLDMASGFAGKGDPIAAAPEGGPMPGQPILPGPSSAAGR